MVTILMFATLVGLVVWSYVHKPASKYDDGEIFARIMGLIFLVVLVPTFVIARGFNTVGNASLELAYTTTIHNYEITLAETKSLISLPGQADGAFINGSMEKLQIASSAASRMTELRDEINHYNELIVSKRAWSHEWFLGGFLWTPPPPKHLVPYVMK